MNWVNNYENFTNREKELFEETANRLLSHTFLVYEREEDRPFYRFAERNLDVFTGYFLLSGWDLRHVQRYSVIQLYNRHERNRYNFNLQQTILLFILRLLYEEKGRDLRLTSQVLVNGRDIQEKYMALQIRSRLPGQEDLQRILRLFQRFSLIELKKGHWKDPEAVYVLYPSLNLVLDPAGLDALAAAIRQDEENLEEDDASPDED